MDRGGESRMSRYESERDAKEYLVGEIVGEANREGTPLTEVERKMLYFSESGWTLPDMMEVNEEFERDHVNDVYERKISGLVRKITRRLEARSEEERVAWDEAVQKLRQADHYLLVLIDSDLMSATGTARPPGDFLKLVLTALVCSFGLVILFGLYEYFFPK
jgi:hypothetical protein